MTAVAPRSDLSPAVARQLGEIVDYFRVDRIARRIWEEVLSPEDRKRLGDDFRLTELPRGYAKLRGCSLERALLDLAMEGSVISVGMQRRLRRQIGEPVESSGDRIRPVWDRDLGKLSYQGVVIRSVKRTATSIYPILGSFQEMGWPTRIPNPLPGGVDSKKLRDALRGLNKDLKTITFYADGTATGILWQAK